MARRVRGRGAKAKGSIFERAIRDELRRVYPPELRQNVNRVPLSGAGSIKGDILDQNNNEFCYECKKQERLNVLDWWRQTLHEAGSWRVPVLVFSSNHRPVYWVMYERDLLEMAKVAGMQRVIKKGGEGAGNYLYDKLAKLKPNQYYLYAKYNLAILDNESYIGLRKEYHKAWTIQQRSLL